jgi:hypothetical protein
MNILEVALRNAEADGLGWVGDLDIKVVLVAAKQIVIFVRE